MDKEIIIDGVDVAGCGYFCEADNECSICGMGTDGEDTFCRDCKDNSNCYYKQFKRLEFELNVTKADYEASEQENKELKAELQKFKDMAKKGLDEFKDVGGCWGCGLQLQLNQDIEDFKKLKAENEQLKALCDTYKTCYQAKHNDIKCLLPKYRTTLQEIKAIADELLEKGLEPQSVEHQLRLKGKRELASIILDLITKAEEE